LGIIKMTYDERDRASRLEVSVTRQLLIPTNRTEVFDFVAAQDVLPKVLTGYGLVPGVASTSGVSGPWDRAGSHRVVHLLDGSTVDEGLTAYDRPGHFAYRVSNPSFALKHLMSHAGGEWWFEPAEGGTHVRWTYTFHAKNRLTKFPLALFVNTQWKGYMDVCLENVVKHFSN
jgi:hypothetical protein